MSKSPGGDYPPKRILDSEQHKREHELHLRRIEYRELIAKIAGSCFFVMSFTAPLWMINLMVSALAGKETDFKVNIAWSVALTGAGFTIMALLIKNRSQSKELKRLRERSEKQEKKLGIE